MIVGEMIFKLLFLCSFGNCSSSCGTTAGNSSLASDARFPFSNNVDAFIVSSVVNELGMFAGLMIIFMGTWAKAVHWRKKIGCHFKIEAQKSGTRRVLVRSACVGLLRANIISISCWLVCSKGDENLLSSVSKLPTLKNSQENAKWRFFFVFPEAMRSVGSFLFWLSSILTIGVPCLLVKNMTQHPHTTETGQANDPQKLDRQFGQIVRYFQRYIFIEIGISSFLHVTLLLNAIYI